MKNKIIIAFLFVAIAAFVLVSATTEVTEKNVDTTLIAECECFDLAASTHTVVVLLNPTSYTVAKSSGLVLMNLTVNLRDKTSGQFIFKLHNYVK